MDPFQGRIGIFHFCTDALKKKILFKERRDYVYGVNSIAIFAAPGRVEVLCYCLMSNHFHVLLRGRLPDCVRFMRKLLMRLAIYVAARDGEKGGFGMDSFDVTPVTSRNQMKKEIAYILRNPLKARIASPISYEWNSADVMFNPQSGNISGSSLKALTVEERRKLFATREKVPEQFEQRDGKILNKSFVRYELAQRCFQDDMDYFNELKRFNNEAEVEGEHLGQEKLFFTDEELIEKMLLMCRKEYYVSSPAALDRKSLLNMATALRVRFGAGKEQLERILGLDDALVSKL